MTNIRDMFSSGSQLRAPVIFAIFSLLPLVAVAFVNYEADPFQYFRVSHPARFSNFMQRFQVPGVIRNYDFDSIVAGNSVVANVENWMFDRKEFQAKPNVANLSLWGSTIREDTYVVTLALETKPIRTVYWAIGRPGVSAEFRYADFPKCMYGGLYRLIPPYCDLLNSNVFWESYVSVSHSDGSQAGWV
jgi:hypothetical protein